MSLKEFFGAVVFGAFVCGMGVAAAMAILLKVLTCRQSIIYPGG